MCLLGTINIMPCPKKSFNRDVFWGQWLITDQAQTQFSYSQLLITHTGCMEVCDVHELSFFIVLLGARMMLIELCENP